MEAKKSCRSFLGMVIGGENYSLESFAKIPIELEWKYQRGLFLKREFRQHPFQVCLKAGVCYTGQSISYLLSCHNFIRKDSILSSWYRDRPLVRPIVYYLVKRTIEYFGLYESWLQTYFWFSRMRKYCLYCQCWWLEKKVFSFPSLIKILLFSF